MKFVKLKRRDTDSYLYNITEKNNFNLDILTSFLTGDAYGKSNQFLEWLINLPISDEYFFFGGNSYYMEVEKDQVTIRPEWYGFMEDYTEGYEDWKFETSKNNMINILKQWIDTVGKDPFAERSKLPLEILITEDNNKFKIQSIQEKDPRFSKLIENSNKPYAKIEKSPIFDNYYRIEANNQTFFKIAMIFSNFSEYKEEIFDLLHDKKNEDGQIYDRCPTGFSTIFKKNNNIYIDWSYNKEEEKEEFLFPIKKSNFLKLLEQWQEIINKDQFPKELILKQEHDQIIFDAKY